MQDVSLQQFYKAIRKPQDIQEVGEVGSFEEFESKYGGQVSYETKKYVAAFLRKKNGDQYWFIGWNFAAFFLLPYWSFYRRIPSFYFFWTAIVCSLLFVNYVLEGNILVVVLAAAASVLSPMLVNGYYVYKVERGIKAGESDLGPSWGMALFGVFTINAIWFLIGFIWGMFPQLTFDQDNLDHNSAEITQEFFSEDEEY